MVASLATSPHGVALSRSALRAFRGRHGNTSTASGAITHTRPTWRKPILPTAAGLSPSSLKRPGSPARVASIFAWRAGCPRAAYGSTGARLRGLWHPRWEGLASSSRRPGRPGTAGTSQPRRACGICGGPQMFVLRARRLPRSSACMIGNSHLRPYVITYGNISLFAHM